MLSDEYISKLNDYRFFKLAYKITYERIKDYECVGECVPCHLPTRLLGLEKIIRSYHTRAVEEHKQ